MSALTPSVNQIELQLLGGSDSDTDIRILSAGVWQNLTSNFNQFSLPGDLPVGYYPVEIELLYEKIIKGIFNWLYFSF